MSNLHTVNIPALPEGYLSFDYQRGSRALIGQWKARVVLSEAPKLGESWSVGSLMVGGVITEAVEQGSTAYGESVWDIGGNDAGFKLMQSPPLPHQIKASDLGGVIKEVVEACGLSADVTLERFTGLDFRHCVSGQTAANVVLDLAMLGGSVAYILPSGTVRVAPPVKTAHIPTEELRLSHVKNMSLDLEGYASGVMLVLHRRGNVVGGGEPGDPGKDPNDPGDPGKDPNDPGKRLPWTGTTPPGSLTTVRKSGSTSLPNGTLAWAYTMLEPIGVLVEYSATLFLPGAGIRKIYLATYNYDIQTSVVRVAEQEQRVWRWGLVDMESLEDSYYTVTRYYDDIGDTKSEQVHRQSQSEVHRAYEGSLERISTEWSQTKSMDSTAPKEAKPRPYDTRTEKVWNWGGGFSDYRGLTTTEYTYEDMDVGEADVVLDEKGDAVTVEYAGSKFVQSVAAKEILIPVRREKVTQTDEIFDRDGKCVSRVERTTDDMGRRDMLERGLYGDIYASKQENAYALAWLKTLPERAAVNVQQMPGSSSITEEVSTMSQAGRRFASGSDPVTQDDLKRYVETPTEQKDNKCPFFLSSGSCGVYDGLRAPYIVDESAPTQDADWLGGGVETPNGVRTSATTPSEEVEMPVVVCDYPDGGFEECPKYKALRHLAGNQSTGEAPAPVVGLAGGGTVWFEKEIYFDEYLSDAAAQKHAQAMAANILKAKGASRGLVETVELPLNLAIAPHGSVSAVHHNFESMRSSVTYLPQNVEVPEYLMLLSAGGVAQNIYARESVGKGRSGTGRVIDIRPDRALVVLGGRPVSCTYSVPVKQGSNVLVFLPPGATASGIIQAVLG